MLSKSNFCVFWLGFPAERYVVILDWSISCGVFFYDRFTGFGNLIIIRFVCVLFYPASLSLTFWNSSFTDFISFGKSWLLFFTRFFCPLFLPWTQFTWYTSSYFATSHKVSGFLFTFFSTSFCSALTFSPFVFVLL